MHQKDTERGRGEHFREGSVACLPDPRWGAEGQKKGHLKHQEGEGTGRGLLEVCCMQHIM